MLKLVGVVTARVEGVRRQGTASHEPRTATLLLASSSTLHTSVLASHTRKVVNTYLVITTNPNTFCITMPKSKPTFEPLPKPPFPESGSTIGPSGKYLSLGKLGSGTFCEISKCIDLSYFHQKHPNPSPKGGAVKRKRNPSLRVVAAKVELTDFKNSGVLDGEATILKHLSDNMREAMIPTFIDYLKTNKKNKEVSTIIMEYLPGEDMNRLRDRNAQFLAVKRNDGQNLQTYRRLSIQDSVYLCKDVFMPLLKNMHDCGAIHRDVKPSNCVRIGPGDNDRGFKLVDFGLSKSFVVPKESSYADTEHSWDGAWDHPPNGKENDSTPEGCIRKERNGAEFRGTSMYASLRVHQLKDYCRRDDIWGLLYVFCDLVSGGLPWMGYAANRDRAMCQKIKEYVHGERLSMEDSVDSNGEPGKICETHIEELLKGADYYLSKHRRDTIISKAIKMGDTPPDEKKLPKLASPLAMMNDVNKCNALREAFHHLAKLGFADKPDYALIEKCLAQFLIDETHGKGEYVPPTLHWKQPLPKGVNKKETKKTPLVRPSLSFMDESDIDPLDESTLHEAEALKEKEMAKEGNSSNASSKVDDLSRLPLQLQFQLAQVEYNAANPNTIPYHLAFRDWVELATSLVYDTWDSEKYERGNHRSNDDGYRRELYIRVVYTCLEAAKPFQNFNSRDCFYYDAEDDEEESSAHRTRRRINVEGNSTARGGGASKSVLLEFSKVICALRASLAIERERTFAPPPALSFGYGMS